MISYFVALPLLWKFFVDYLMLKQGVLQNSRAARRFAKERTSKPEMTLTNIKSTSNIAYIDPVPSAVCALTGAAITSVRSKINIADRPAHI